MSLKQPTKRSTMEEICDLRKSCVNKILEDDFGARDSMEGSLKMKGDSSKGENFIKYNSNLGVKTSDGSFAFKYSDNVEFRTHFMNLAVKAKLKNGRFFEHYDFGFKSWTKKWGDQEKTIWKNPYFRWGATTSLTNLAFSLGFAAYWCEHFNNRTQLNYNSLDAVDGNSAWSLCSRKQFSKGNFWLDYCGRINLGNFKNATIKTLRMGWNEAKWGLVAQANTVQMFNGGCPVKDSISVGACWMQKGIGTLAGKVKHFMDDRPMGFEVGFLRKVNDKITMKGKIDQDMNFNVHGKIDCCKNTTVETTLSTNLSDSEKISGIYDLPFNVGLKIKMNR